MDILREVSLHEVPDAGSFTDRRRKKGVRILNMVTLCMPHRYCVPCCVSKPVSPSDVSNRLIRVASARGFWDITAENNSKLAKNRSVGPVTEANQTWNGPQQYSRFTAYDRPW